MNEDNIKQASGRSQHDKVERINIGSDISSSCSSRWCNNIGCSGMEDNKWPSSSGIHDSGSSISSSSSSNVGYGIEAHIRMNDWRHSKQFECKPFDRLPGTWFLAGSGKSSWVQVGNSRRSSSIRIGGRKNDDNKRASGRSQR